MIRDSIAMLERLVIVVTSTSIIYSAVEGIKKIKTTTEHFRQNNINEAIQELIELEQNRIQWAWQQPDAMLYPLNCILVLISMEILDIYDGDSNLSVLCCWSGCATRQSTSKKVVPLSQATTTTTMKTETIKYINFKIKKVSNVPRIEHSSSVSLRLPTSHDVGTAVDCNCHFRSRLRANVPIAVDPIASKRCPSTIRPRTVNGRDADRMLFALRRQRR